MTLRSNYMTPSGQPTVLSPGVTLDTWLMRRGCDQRTINRITARRFQYGSYRPSDRAALLLDASPELTPYAVDDRQAAD